jgi:hypothetical protein
MRRAYATQPGRHIRRRPIATSELPLSVRSHELNKVQKALAPSIVFAIRELGLDFDIQIL